jgi:uncharacterized membrane protein
MKIHACSTPKTYLEHRMRFPGENMALVDRVSRVVCGASAAFSSSSSGGQSQASDDEEEEFYDDDDEEEEDILEEMEAESGEFPSQEGGYTPFEFIEFTNIPMKHEVTVRVERPISDCYKVWDSRLNWMQWFDMIDEIGFHEEEPSYMSMYMWYRWATTPFLELYVTLERTEEKVNKYILEEPVEGFPLVAAVLFHSDGDDDPATTITLRISYLLPKVLHEFAGRMAVYGDVNKKLQKCMDKMKHVVEAVDMDVLDEIQKDNEQVIKENFEQERKKKQAQKNTPIAADMGADTAAEVDKELLSAEEGNNTAKVRKGRGKTGTKRNPSSSSSEIL